MLILQMSDVYTLYNSYFFLDVILHCDIAWYNEAISQGLVVLQGIYVKSSPPSDGYMRQWIGSALVQIMACRLVGDKPLSKPIPRYCQLGP